MSIKQVDAMEPPSLMATTSPFDEEVGISSPNKEEIVISSSSGRSRKVSERSSTRTSSSSPSSERRRKRPNNRRRENVVSPERDMKLTMCGADINDEVKMALVDVRVSLRQIVSTIQTFGPEEKEYVRATLKDRKSTVGKKVRQLAVCTSSSSTPPRKTKVTFNID